MLMLTSNIFSYKIVDNDRKLKYNEIIGLNDETNPYISFLPPMIVPNNDESHFIINELVSNSGTLENNDIVLDRR